MRRLISRIVALTLLGTAPAWAAPTPLPLPPPVPAAPATGSLYIDTVPTGADVWLDGTYAGRSPKLVDALALGRHTVTVAKAGWQGRDLAVSVTDADVPTIATIALGPGEATPSRGNGRLALHSNDPLPATVFVDGSGVALSKGGCDLPAGVHTIVLFTTHGRLTRRVTIYADMTTDVFVREEGDSEGAK